MPFAFRPVLRTALRCALVLACGFTLTLARGWLMARMQGGRYATSSALLDAVALLGLAGVVFAMNRALFVVAARLTRSRSKGVRVAVTTLRLLVLFFVAGPMVLAAAQMHPQRILPRTTPADLGLDYHSVSFDADDHRLSGWWSASKEQGRPAVVLAHGIGANKEQVLYPAMLLSRQGFNVLLFDSRAHGESEGFLSTIGEREARDVKAAHDFVARAAGKVPIYGIGYSMGGSSVLRAAHDFGIFDKIIVDCTYARLEDVAEAQFLRFTGPLRGFVWLELRMWAWALAGLDISAHQPEDVVGQLGGRPLLLIHGKADRTIPFTESLRLKAAAGATAQIWLVDGVGHIAPMTRPEYGERIGAFLEGEASH